jgi:hypothetical protein
MGLKAVLLPQGVVKGGQHLVIQLQHLSALLADEVVMSPLTGQFVTDAPAAQVNLIDDVQLFQQLQRAVDCGDVDAGVAGPHPGIDVLSADVALAFVDGLQHHLPLRCQAVALLTQVLDQLEMAGHLRPLLSANDCRCNYTTTGGRCQLGVRSFYRA